MRFISQGYDPIHNIAWIPLLALFDFAAAFPSIIHGWILVCLRHRGFPPGFIAFIEAIYFRASACAFVEGILKTLFYFEAGVLQGCPASAFLFNLSVDPFLNFFQKQLDLRAYGMLRACADDIGAALRTLSALWYLRAVFERAQGLAGLSLKPIKCIIIPLVPFSEEVVSAIRSWLRRNIPKWEHVQVKKTAK